MSTSIKKQTDRIDFKRGVPELLYKRAGGKCSVPRCTRPTMGPFSEFDGTVNMGVACHIYSASENGPRGRGERSEDFISSQKNGIWCCQYHASLIDKNKGIDYPASTLFAWKELAEARVQKQMNDIPSPLGWVESIEFTQFSHWQNPPKIKLSHRTLMWGKNGSGKTSLLEVAASISRSKYAERFRGTGYKDENGNHQYRTFSSKTIYSTVDNHSKEVEIRITGEKISRLENKIPCLLPPGDIEVIYCSCEDCYRLKDEDDIDYFMRVLNIDKVTLFALVSIGTNSLMPGEMKFQHAMDNEEDDYDCETLVARFKEDGNPYYQLVFKKKGKDEFLSFSCLSASEKNRLIADLLITKAREVCKQRLTLLLLENQSLVLDIYNFKNLLESLEKENFQVVVSTPPSIAEEIVAFNNTKPLLKSLDYLENWTLSVIGESTTGM